jgi:hypothetical protein
MTSVRKSITPINNSVAYSATSVTLFNSVPNSGFRTVVNATDKKLYLYFSAGNATTTTANTRILAAGESWTFPTPVYNNVVTAIGEAAGTGSWNTTEYVG